MLTGCAYHTVEIATPTTQCGMCYGNIIDTLNKAAGFLRRELRERVMLRNIPHLQFIFDDSIEKAQRMLDLISDVRSSDNTG